MDRFEVAETGDGGLQTAQTDVAVVSGKMSNTSAGNVEVSPKSRTPHENEYDTPPDNFAEAVSPTSSRKRGLLRAVSLGYSPTAARARRQASPSARSISSRHLPRPILTGNLFSRLDTAQAQDLPPQSGDPSAHSVVEHDRPLADGINAEPAPLSQNPSHPTTELPWNELRPHVKAPHISARVKGFEVPSKDPRDVNPYARRADEIGPTHRIPGVGYLGDVLVPPGWKEGDEPITPEEAQELYNKARKEAQDALNQIREEIEMLPEEEQDKGNAERDREWSKQFKKDDLLLRERISIYDQYHERQHLKAQRYRQRGPLRNHNQYPLQTLQPPTTTSIPNYPERLTPIMIPRRSISGLELQSSEQGRQQALGSSTNYADPGSLDPSLLSQSVPAVYHRFQSSQMEMLRKKAANEHQFGSFLSQYSGHANAPISPSLNSPLTGPQAGPFASIHTGYHVHSAVSQSGSLPRPLPYVSPTQARFAPFRNTLPRISPLDMPMNAGMESSFPIGPEASRYPVGSLFQENRLAGMIDTHASETRSDPNALTLDTSGPSAQVIKPKKKRASRAKPAELKEKAWYYEDVQRANLPTSFISEEARQAGEEFEHRQSKETKAKKAAAPKPQRPRHGRKPAFDPSKGFPISARAAEQLIKGGFLKEEQHQDTLLPNPSMGSQAGPSVSSGPGSHPVEPPQPQYPTPGPQVNFIYSQQPTAVSASSSVGNDVVSPLSKPEDKSVDVGRDVDEFSDSGSEQADDSKDESFGTPSRRKSATQKQSATRGRKRKLNNGAFKIKRSRFSTDGSKDEEESTTQCTGISSESPQGRQVDGFVSTKVPIPAPANTIRNPYGPSLSLPGSQNHS
ncbi:MAG: hypothetical protein M1830_003896 [Pleopsidium flavum]|nr:MAG: hypothetical protein M1830_003896 [Pleopsidium flavum]